MWNLGRSFFSMIPADQTLLARLLSSTLSRRCFYSSTVLQKKKDSSHESPSNDSTLLDIPQKPKRPASSFIRFAMAMRPTILRDNPKLPKTDIIRYAAAMWKNTDVETRVQYQIEYYTELEKYEDAIQKYKSSLTEEQAILLKKFEIRKKENRVQKKIKEKFKELEKPKRPLNSFTLFVVSRKDELKKIRANVYCHKVVKEWEALPEKEKNEFRKRGKKLQEEYKKKLAEWKERVGPMNIMQILKNKSFEEAKEFLNEPPVVDPNISLEDDEKRNEI